MQTFTTLQHNNRMRRVSKPLSVLLVGNAPGIKLMFKNKKIVLMLLLVTLSSNKVMAQSLNDGIKSAGISTCECINNSKYYSNELVDSVFAACQSKHLSEFKEPAYGSYEFDHFGNPIGELLNLYLKEMFAYCPTRITEFKKSKKIFNSDEYVIGKYTKIEQTGIFEEIEFLGECGETYKLVNTSNYITRELMSPLAKELDMNYYQFVIASTDYPIKLFYKELEAIDTTNNVKKQIKFVIKTDSNYAASTKLQKIMGTYRDNCNQ